MPHREVTARSVVWAVINAERSNRATSASTAARSLSSDSGPHWVARAASSVSICAHTASSVINRVRQVITATTRALIWPARNSSATAGR